MQRYLAIFAVEILGFGFTVRATSREDLSVDPVFPFGDPVDDMEWSDAQLQATIAEVERAEESTGSGDSFLSAAETLGSLVHPDSINISSESFMTHDAADPVAITDGVAVTQVDEARAVSVTKRKRARQSPSSAPVRTVEEDDEEPRVTGRLTKAEKMACLEVMIESINSSPSVCLQRIARRIPHADMEAARDYRMHTLAMTKVPEWFHSLLLSHAGDLVDYDSITQAVSSVVKRSRFFWRGSVRYSVEKWMYFCIKPLRAAGGETKDTCEKHRSHMGNPTVWLVGAQLRKFLEVELSRLTESPYGDIRSLPRRRMLCGIDDSVTDSLSTTTVPPNSKERITIARPAKSASASAAVSDADKFVFLELLVHKPDATPSEFAALAKARLPHVAKSSAIYFFYNTMARTLLPSLAHDYLLSVKATRVDASILAALRGILGKKAAGVRCGIPSHARIWIQYCIRPMMADPVNSQCYCSPDSRKGGPATVMRLSTSQRRAFFSDMLADMTRNRLNSRTLPATGLRFRTDSV